MGAADVEGLGSQGVTATNVYAQADLPPFARLVTAEQENLTVPIMRTFSLGDAGQGLELFRTGHTRGKYVVRVGG